MQKALQPFKTTPTNKPGHHLDLIPSSCPKRRCPPWSMRRGNRWPASSLNFEILCCFAKNRHLLFDQRHTNRHFWRGNASLVVIAAFVITPFHSA